MSEQDLRLGTDQAHMAALDLSAHVLEYANAYRLITGQKEFMGRRRLRHMLLLLIFDEMGKLMEIMKECERAVTAKDPYVKIEGFYERNKDDKALSNILKELGKSEMLFALFTRIMGRAPSMVDFESFKDQFAKGSQELGLKIDRALYYDISAASDHAEDIPDDQVMDMFFEAMVMNAEGAREFIQEWARAKELDVNYRLRSVKNDPACGAVKLWFKEEVSKQQRNF
ncbi:MAG TPA: hypothetical protein VLH13_00770 [Methanomassiliicoccales archaeon]|nr:hypothetical protein [Methanomassiliicoccales archaeon]